MVSGSTVFSSSSAIQKIQNSFWCSRVSWWQGENPQNGANQNHKAQTETIRQRSGELDQTGNQWSSHGNAFLLIREVNGSESQQRHGPFSNRRRLARRLFGWLLFWQWASRFTSWLRSLLGWRSSMVRPLKSSCNEHIVLKEVQTSSFKVLFHSRNVSERLRGDQTNQRAELAVSANWFRQIISEFLLLSGSNQCHGNRCLQWSGTVRNSNR